MLRIVKTQFADKVHNSFFEKVHNHCLIYNTCWEDPRIDRQLMRLDNQSKVVMITSAGCNALDYLLDSPAEVHTIDVNPRQNALLQLKLSLFEHGSFQDLFSMFGKGFHHSYKETYNELRPWLPLYAQNFWDKKIHYFERTPLKASFYYRGTSGNVAWFVMNFLMRLKKNIRDYLFRLLDTHSLDEQRTLYYSIEAELWNAFHRWLVKHPVVLTMFGVPKAQIQLITQQYPGGVSAYVREKLKHVFTEVLMKDNYFWRVYLTGSYTPMCCPNYLKREHFNLLRDNVQRISTYTSTLTQFLKTHPKSYTHFVLLDHQDWLAEHHSEMLKEEWQHILKCSQTGTKILMRSASERLNFLPSFVTSSLRFFPDVTNQLHLQDRVGTYGSMHFAEVL